MAQYSLVYAIYPQRRTKIMTTESSEDGLNECFQCRTTARCEIHYILGLAFMSLRTLLRRKLKPDIVLSGPGCQISWKVERECNQSSLVFCGNKLKTALNGKTHIYSQQSGRGEITCYAKPRIHCCDFFSTKLQSACLTHYTTYMFVYK